MKCGGHSGVCFCQKWAKSDTSNKVVTSEWLSSFLTAHQHKGAAKVYGVKCLQIVRASLPNSTAHSGKFSAYSNLTKICCTSPKLPANTERPKNLVKM